MSGYSAPDLVKRDVASILRWAEVTIEITPAGGIEEHVNPDPGLRVIGVIGQGAINHKNFCGQKFEKAVLMEIGISRGRPYGATVTPIDSFDPEMHRTIARRRGEYFSITEEQYIQAAPCLWKHIQRIADERINRWKRGPKYPIELPTQRTFMHARTHKIIQSLFPRRPQPKGVRFSVSKHDTYLIQDIFFAELFCNPRFRRAVTGLAKFIHQIFSRLRYSANDKNLYALVKNIKERGIPTRIIYEARSFALNHPRIIPGYDAKEAILLWKIFFEKLDLPDLEICPERALADGALPDAHERLDGIQLRVSTGINENKNYIVFEVYSSAKLNTGVNKT